jgi:hypothetical protein
MNINVFIIQRLASKQQTKSLFFTFLLLFRPIRGIRGLMREVIVALTTNIESQVRQLGFLTYICSLHC